MAGLFLPSTLGRLAMRDWQFPKHVQAMQRASLDLIYDPMVNRLVIEEPVRHGKSVFWSHIFPSWYTMVFPNRNTIITSYGDDFASEWSAKIRDTVSYWGPKLTGCSIDSSYRAKSHFKMKAPHAGEVRGIGIGGALAGKGAHLIIADDLVKEFSEVVTKEARDKLYDRFHGELLTRVEPGGKVVIVMSRRHPEDLSGKLLASNPTLAPDQRWHRLRFPALGANGRALWPARYPAKKLRAIRADHEAAGTSWQWWCLYQQDPRTAPEACEWPGSYWENIFYQKLPTFTPRRKLLALEPSMGTDRKTGAFSALLYGLVDASGTLWIEKATMSRMPREMVEDRAVRTLELNPSDGFAIQSNKGQLPIAIKISEHRGTPIFFYDHKDPREVRVRMGISRLLADGKIRIRETDGGKILAAQLRDFPLDTHQDGPAALALMLQLWADLECPQPSGGDVSIYTR